MLPVEEEIKEAISTQRLYTVIDHYHKEVSPLPDGYYMGWTNDSSDHIRCIVENGRRMACLFWMIVAFLSFILGGVLVWVLRT